MAEFPLESIIAHAQVLQETIGRLMEQRQLLLNQANLHYSSTKALPNELLSLIFQNACDTVSYSNALEAMEPQDVEADNRQQPSVPVVLGSVCSHWRNIVHSSPRLWMTLNIEVTRRNVKQTIHLVRMHEQNCRNFNLEVQFDFRRQMHLDNESRNPIPFKDLLEPLRKLVVQQHPNRFAGIRLLDPPCNWIDVGNNIFSNLHTISLAYTDGYSTTTGNIYILSDHLNMEAYPLLSHVSLYASCTPSMRWEQLVSLELVFITHDICIDIVGQCKRLRSVTMAHICFYCEEDDGIPIPITTLDHLEYFEWSFPLEYPSNSSPEISMTIANTLQNIQLPVVKTIVLRSLFKRVIESTEFITKFYNCLPASLTDLTLDFAYVDEAHGPAELLSWKLQIWRCIELIPQSVTHLHFQNICLGFISYFFLNISAEWNSIRVREKALFPLLTRLEITEATEEMNTPKCTFPHTHGTRVLSSDLETFLCAKQRRFGLESEFHLSINGYQTGDAGLWVPDFKRKVAELKRREFNVSFSMT